MSFNKANLAQFSDVKKFFESWGLCPSGEPQASLVSPPGMNTKVFAKLLAEARTHIHSSHYGSYFYGFCLFAIDLNGRLYRQTWQELETDWEDHIANL